MARVYADVSEEVHEAFYVAARKRKTNGKRALKKFIAEFIAEAEGLDVPNDPHADILDKAREMLEKGGREAQSMADAILGAAALYRAK